MWYTNIVGTLIGTSWAGNIGFKLTGSGSQVNDLSIDSIVHSSRADAGGKAITVTATNWRVQNVWITHTNVGFWVSLSSNGLIQRCRVRCTYADGININDGSNHNLIEDCSVRGCGDDGIALLSEARDKAITSQNTVRRNSVTAIWWGANCDIAGGNGEIIENNYLADNALGECFTVNLPPSFPMHPLTGATILHNTILRGGSNFSNQKRGAIWIYAGSAPISNLIISENLIIDAVYSAIHLAGHFRQQLIASNNIISNPGGDGIYIGPEVSGSGSFIHNTVVGLPKGASIINNGSDLFTFTKEPN